MRLYGSILRRPFCSLPAAVLRWGRDTWIGPHSDVTGVGENHWQAHQRLLRLDWRNQHWRDPGSGDCVWLELVVQDPVN